MVNNKTLREAKQGMIVIHTLPRSNEIGEEVDFN
jgi:carbamoyl-phosphate synthase/aspartate carbamoyltransferase